jgi:hypothetical protein
MRTLEIVRNSESTYLECTGQRLRLHVGRSGLSRVSHTVGGTALYAGQNIGIPPTEDYMEDLFSDPTTGDSVSPSVEASATPSTSDTSERLTEPAGQLFSITRAWSSRSSQSKTTRASRNS